MFKLFIGRHQLHVTIKTARLLGLMLLLLLRHNDLQLVVLLRVDECWWCVPRHKHNVLTLGRESLRRLSRCWRWLRTRMECLLVRLTRRGSGRGRRRNQVRSDLRVRVSVGVLIHSDRGRWICLRGNCLHLLSVRMVSLHHLMRCRLIKDRLTSCLRHLELMEL